MSLPSQRSSRHVRAALMAIVALVATTPVRAQVVGVPSADDEVLPFTNFWLTTGKLAFDVNRLNPRFARPDLASTGRSTGFDALSGGGLIIGGGGYVPIGRLLLGGEFHYSDMGTESSPTGKTNQLTTNYGMATVGYALWTSWHWTVFPYLGAGIGKVTLTLKSRDGGPVVPSSASPTFDDIVLSPGAESRMVGTYYVVQPGLGVDYLALNSSNSHVGVTFGLRVGTSISPHRTTWTYRGNDVFGAPDASPVGATARIIFGIGGFKMSR